VPKAFPGFILDDGIFNVRLWSASGPSQFN
jgi:hypothetical protein